MAPRALILPFAFLALTSASPTAARGGDPEQRALFVQKHPCPASGKTGGVCSGYVVNHVVPLCSGGRDLPSNMRWQPVAETQARERHKLCHRTKAKLSTGSQARATGTHADEASATGYQTQSAAENISVGSATKNFTLVP